MRTRCLTALLLCGVMCLLSFFSVIPAAAEEPALPSLEEAEAVILLHPESGNTVLSKNADEVVYAGSAVKVLSGMIFCEELSSRRQEAVMITSEMLKGVSGRVWGIKRDEVYTIEMLLYLAVCGSYNDAYYVLASVISDSVNAFAVRMNTRAAELGALHSSFTEPGGITDSSRTTASDMAKIALAAYKNTLYMVVSSTANGLGGTVKNNNALVSSAYTTAYYNGKCRGMSAGNTTNAGNCVITSATVGEEIYLSVVLGGKTNDTDRNYGYIVTNRILSWVEKNYSYREILSPETVLCSIPVTVSDMTESVPVRTKDSLSAFLPIGAAVGTDITYSIRLSAESLEAPVSEGMFVGYVAVFYRGNPIGTLELYTAGSAERSTVVSVLNTIRSLTGNRVFLSGFVFFVLASAGWITAETVLSRRRRKKWNRYFDDRNSYYGKYSDPAKKADDQKK